MTWCVYRMPIYIIQYLCLMHYTVYIITIIIIVYAYIRTYDSSRIWVYVNLFRVLCSILFYLWRLPSTEVLQNIWYYYDICWEIDLTNCVIANTITVIYLLPYNNCGHAWYLFIQSDKFDECDLWRPFAGLKIIRHNIPGHSGSSRFLERHLAKTVCTSHWFTCRYSMLLVII